MMVNAKFVMLLPIYVHSVDHHMECQVILAHHVLHTAGVVKQIIMFVIGVIMIME